MNRVSLRLTPVFIIVLLLGAQGLSGQSLTPSVIPSEDELSEALELGEIDFAQYQQLVEYALLGVSLGNPYIFDILPTVSGLFYDPELKAVRAEPIADRKKARLLVRQSWSEELEADGRLRYRSAVAVTPSPIWRADLRVSREYTGRERVVYRSLCYKPDRTSLESITLGNFTTRFGLGTVFGYGGKVLSYAQSIEPESIFFPDYGGANGLLVKSRAGRLKMSTALSVQRDTDFGITAAALQLSPLRRSALPSPIIGYTEITNRSSERTARDVKLALFEQVRFGRTRMTMELASQLGQQRSWAAVAEGMMVGSDMTMSATVWAYGDRYLSLQSGSKTGALSRRTCLESVGLEFSDRRAGQEGVALESTCRFTSRWRAVLSADYAGFDRSDYRLQWQPAIVFDCSRRLVLRLHHQAVYRRACAPAGIGTDQSSRTRLECRIKSDNWQARSYIALVQRPADLPYGSLLLQLTVQSADIARTDLWLTLDRICQEQVSYWYAYVRHRCRMFSGFELGVKLAHRFSRSAEIQNYTTVTLEMTAAY